MSGEACTTFRSSWACMSQPTQSAAQAMREVSWERGASAATLTGCPAE